jgi:hypothetical protein
VHLDASLTTAHRGVTLVRSRTALRRALAIRRASRDYRRRREHLVAGAVGPQLSSRSSVEGVQVAIFGADVDYAVMSVRVVSRDTEAEGSGSNRLFCFILSSHSSSTLRSWTTIGKAMV